MKKRYIYKLNDSSVNFLEVKNLNYQFHKKTLYQNLNLILKKGEAVSLIGYSGSGKSTLITIIAQLRHFKVGSITYGFARNRLEVRENIGMQFQNLNYPEGFLVKDVINLFTYFVNNKNRLSTEKFSELLKILAIEGFWNQKITNLSGGQQQRINIFLALVKNPSLLILDEITIGLDLITIKEIQNFILDYIHSNNKNLLLISHNYDEIKALTTQFYLLKNQTLHGPYLTKDLTFENFKSFINKDKNRLTPIYKWHQKINRNLQTHYLKFLLKFQKKLLVKTSTEEKINFEQSSKISMPMRIINWQIKVLSNSINYHYFVNTNYEDQITNKIYDFWISKSLPWKESLFGQKKLILKNNDNILEVNNLTKILNKKLIFSNLNFSIKNGERVAISGPNGAGKSTLITLLGKLDSPTSGNFVFSFGNSKDDIVKNLGIQFQDFSFPQIMTVWDVVLFFARANRNSLNKAELTSLLKEFYMFDLKLAKIANLSQGEQQRLSILISLIKKPKLLIMDEISTGLDAESTEIINSYLERYLQNNNATLILISHNYLEISRLTDRLLVLKDGKVKSDIKFISHDYEYIRKQLEEIYN